MLRKFREFVADPETWPGFLVGLLALAMLPGEIGVMFGSMAVYLVFLFIACFIGATLLGGVGVFLAFWGGVFLFVGSVILHLVKFFTGQPL